MPNQADVVTVDFLGATGIKRRPAVVISSDLYHSEQPDVILGVLTSNLRAATSSSDYILQDWGLAGLRMASAFRCYLNTARATQVRTIGRLSARDWAGVQTSIQ